MSASLASKLGRCAAKNSLLFVCDMQEKFRPSIRYFDQIAETSSRLIRTANILKIPIVVTEQYPKGLGPTVPELKQHLKDVEPVAKTRFSMCVQPVVDALKAHPERNSVILCGIEAHACIQQSAIDLKLAGYEVFVVADACSSRGESERMLAFTLLKQIGCFLTSTESVILSLAEGKDHPNFKEISSIIKDKAPDTGLVPVLGAGKL